jgi:hypothetical protein
MSACLDSIAMVVVVGSTFCFAALQWPTLFAITPIRYDDAAKYFV